jgi:hypothetical protein
METPSPIPPETKDWTWVLERPCPECGYDAATVSRDELPARIRRNATAWIAVLSAGEEVATRPAPTTWSPLEYACHVRDVHRVFGERVRRMLESDDPQFPNWDQDASAVENRYGDQDPAAVAADLVVGADAIANRFAAVRPDEWDRPGRRSDGAVFTVESLGRYYLHDIEHHVHDVPPTE